jgi:pimeloyl-ACP methyl ester carboxylesterase
MTPDPTVHEFRINCTDAELYDLRSRLANTRWPARETVSDWSQGIPLDIVQEMVEHWAKDYYWPARQERLNRFPQFTTVIDGLRIHFVHVVSRHPHAIPLVLTHGWPGSFVEFLKLVEPLTNPEDPADAFSLVIPSLPGFAFSEIPRDPGWGVARTARAWAELMTRLGYERFAAGGSDWGTSVSASLGIQFPERIIGLQLIPPLAPPDPATFESLTPFEQRALRDLKEANERESGYSAIQSTKPQTLSYGLVDSPVALCAWILEKFWSWTDNRGDLQRVISRDDFLDNLMVYWMTRTGASSTRMYWESLSEVWNIFNREVVDHVTVPVGASIFPHEVPRVSQRWAARRFTDIRQWHELDRGGHFAALEQPDLVVEEFRSFLRPLR